MIEKIKNIGAKPIVQIIFLVILTLVLRLYKIDSPLADWHSFRQADTASVAYEYYLSGAVNLLIPRYHDLSNIQSGEPNPEGYRMVEFPLINGIVGWIMIAFDNANVELIYRLVDVILSGATTAGFYLLIYELSGKKQKGLAFLSAFILATLPFNVYYGRSVLPEIGVLFGHVFSLYTFTKYLQLTKRQVKSKKEKRRKLFGQIVWGILTTTLLASTLLIKPSAAFIAPVLIYLAIAFLGKRAFTHWPLYVMAFLSATPVLLWRDWIQNFPAGIPALDWLFNGSNNIVGEPGMRLKPPWFRWIFIERIVKLIMGFWGLILMTIGLVRRLGKKWDIIDGFCLIYILSMLLFLIVISTGNIQHDYYQVMIVPALIVAVSKGIMVLLKSFPTQLKNIVLDKKQWVLIGMGILGAILLAMLFNSVIEISQPEQLLSWQLLVVLILIAVFVFLFVIIKNNVFLATLAIVGFFIGYFSLWNLVGNYYVINNPTIVEAGEVADALLPEDAKVIAPYASDTAFLFQIKRLGWPMGFDIDEKIAQGATHYVTVNMDDEANELEGKYQTVAKTDVYLILDLRAPLASESGTLKP